MRSLAATSTSPSSSLATTTMWLIERSAAHGPRLRKGRVYFLGPFFLVLYFFLLGGSLLRQGRKECREKGRKEGRKEKKRKEER